MKNTNRKVDDLLKVNRPIACSKVKVESRDKIECIHGSHENGETIHREL